MEDPLKILPLEKAQQNINIPISFNIIFVELLKLFPNFSLHSNIGNYALEKCNYSSALLFLKKGSI